MMDTHPPHDLKAFSFYDRSTTEDLKKQLIRLKHERLIKLRIAWKRRRYGDEWSRKINLHNARCWKYYVKTLEQYLENRKQNEQG
jgi:hypothetical protein